METEKQLLEGLKLAYGALALDMDSGSPLLAKLRRIIENAQVR